MNSVPVKRRTRLASVLTGAVAAAALSVAASPAFAEGDPTGESTYNNNLTVLSMEKCAEHSEDFRFRFYYHSDYKGAWVNVGHPIYDLKAIGQGDGSYPALYFCGGTGDGAGQQVANNAASAYNWFNAYCGTVYYNHGYRGAQDDIFSRSGANLTNTKNNDRSVNFRPCW
ncbi:hypothetical protein ACWD4B_23875 [Streptomyces sp. NPDC002536]